MPEMATVTAHSTVEPWGLDLMETNFEPTPVIIGHRASNRAFGSEYLCWHIGAAEDSLRPTQPFGATWTILIEATAAAPIGHGHRYFESTDVVEGAGAKANATRLQLLARKYVSGTLSPEENARLAIVSEIVRGILPSVTPEDFALLEEIEERRARRKADADAVLKELGIE